MAPKAGTAAHSRTSCSGETPVSDGVNSRASSSGSGRRMRIEQRRERRHRADAFGLAGEGERHPASQADAHQRDATRIDARVGRQPLERHARVRDQVGQRVLAARAPRAAVVNVQAMHAAIAQVDGQVEVLLVAGDAVQQEDGRPGLRTRGAVQRTQEAEAAGLKHDTVEACRVAHPSAPKVAAKACRARRCCPGPSRPAPIVFSDRCVTPSSSQPRTCCSRAVPSPLPYAMPRFDAEGGARPACVRKERIQSIERRPRLGGLSESGHHPAIRQARRTLQRGFGRGAEPDRDRPLDGQRIEAGVGDGVPLALECDQWLRPQQAQQRHLLLEALAASVKVLSQRLILDGVPPEPDAQAQPPAAEHVERGGLLGDHGGLALGKDEDARGKLDAQRDGGHVTEEHERFQERGLVGVRPGPAARPIRIRPQDVIVGDDVTVAGRLSRLREIAHGDWIVPELGLWEDDADAHPGLRTPLVRRGTGRFYPRQARAACHELRAGVARRCEVPRE